MIWIIWAAILIAEQGLERFTVYLAEAAGMSDMVWMNVWLWRLMAGIGCVYAFIAVANKVLRVPPPK